MKSLLKYVMLGIRLPHGGSGFVELLNRVEFTKSSRALSKTHRDRLKSEVPTSKPWVPEPSYRINGIHYTIAAQDVH